MVYSIICRFFLYSILYILVQNIEFFYKITFCGVKVFINFTEFTKPNIYKNKITTNRRHIYTEGNKC